MKLPRANRRESFYMKGNIYFLSTGLPPRLTAWSPLVIVFETPEREAVRSKAAPVVYRPRLCALTVLRPHTLRRTDITVQLHSRFKAYYVNSLVVKWKACAEGQAPPSKMPY